MRSLIIVLLLLVGCRGNKLVPVSECGQPCNEGFDTKMGIGACRQGQWSCDDEGKRTVCLGAVYPTAEICDGLDNDCNGDVDRQRQPCSTACGKGTEVCLEGRFYGCDAPLPAPEICDGKDNDCNGVVDDPSALPVQFCYDGPADSLIHPNTLCGPGIRRCEFGQLSCVGQHLPTAELCDGKDNDCDGQIDEGTNAPSDVDIVFVVDNSGSMGGVIAKVQVVVNGFVQKYAGRADLRWAIVGAPGPDITNDRPILLADFTTPTLFAATMALQGANGAGSEYTVDAIDMLINPANPLALTWKAGARKSIVVLTDEEPQNNYTTSNYQTIAGKIAGTPQVDVVVFTDFNQANTFYAWVTAVTRPHVYDINQTELLMAADLEKIIQQNSCR